MGQSHYDFTTALLQLVIKQKEINEIKFLNRGWWYSLNNLSKLATLQAEKYGLQFLIINQLAANPERELVIYKLFSTENTVSYDEIWELINGFSTNFFLKKYTEYAKNDDRPKLKKYYQYFIARLHMQKGNYREAFNILKKILTKTEIDVEYETLFLSRVYLAYANCLKQADKEQGALQYVHKAYTDYPQLIPFQRLKVSMRLHANASSQIEKEVVDKLKDINVNWIPTNKKSEDAIDVYLKFGVNQGYPTITFETNYKDAVVVTSKTISYKESEKVAKELALYLFNIGNVDKEFNMNEPTVASY